MAKKKRGKKIDSSPGYLMKVLGGKTAVYDYKKKKVVASNIKRTKKRRK